jgi:hypothetical protein
MDADALREHATAIAGFFTDPEHGPALKAALWHTAIAAFAAPADAAGWRLLCASYLAAGPDKPSRPTFGAAFAVLGRRAAGLLERRPVEQAKDVTDHDTGEVRTVPVTMTAFRPRTGASLTAVLRALVADHHAPEQWARRERLAEHARPSADSAPASGRSGRPSPPCPAAAPSTPRTPSPPCARPTRHTSSPSPTVAATRQGTRLRVWQMVCHMGRDGPPRRVRQTV